MSAVLLNAYIYNTIFLFLCQLRWQTSNGATHLISVLCFVLRLDLMDTRLRLTILVNDGCLNPAFFQMTFAARSHPETVFVCLPDVRRHRPTISGYTNL